MLHLVIPIGLAASLFGGLALVHEAGYIIGRRAKGKGKETAGLAAVQGAMLGLLGLLLAFSYAGAAQRFSDRQDLLVRETNAIGTLWLRSDLLDDGQRATLREAIREYVSARLELGESGDAARIAELATRLEGVQERMWAAARDAVRGRPELALTVLPPLNEVIDLFAERNAAVQRHLPKVVLVVLLLSAGTSIATVAYGFGLTGGRHLGTMWALVLVIASALWVTIDLDYPRMGLIQIGLDPIESLKRQISR